MEICSVYKAFCLQVFLSCLHGFLSVSPLFTGDWGGLRNGFRPMYTGGHTVRRLTMLRPVELRECGLLFISSHTPASHQ